MREYRDELASAHERIAHLENALGMRPAPARPQSSDRGWVTAVVVGVLGFGLLAAAGGAVFGFRQWKEQANVPAVATPVASNPQVSVSYYTPQGLPVLADIDGDGTKDFIMFLWSSAPGDGDRQMYVGAVDGKSFDARWGAGPYPGQWNGTRSHLEVVGDTVIVTDSQENVHVLSLAKGLELGTTKVEGGVRELCALGGGSKGRAFIRAGEGQGEAQMFDPATGKLSALPSGASCTERRPSCGAESGAATNKASDVCSFIGSPPDRPRKVYRGFGFGEKRVGLEVPPDGQGRVVGWKSGAKTIAWDKSIAEDNDRLHFGSPHYDSDGERFMTLYQSKSGPFHLVTHDMTTGEELWRRDISPSFEGSWVNAFAVEEGNVLITIDHHFYIFDAASTEQHDLSSITLPRPTSE